MALSPEVQEAINGSSPQQVVDLHWLCDLSTEQGREDAIALMSAFPEVEARWEALAKQAIGEMALKISLKKRFWVSPALITGVVLCDLFRREELPTWFFDFIVRHGIKVEMTE